MPTPEIEEFARILMTEVRDRAIANCDMLLSPDGNSHVAKRWRDTIETGSRAELASMMIPDCVDSALFYLLYAIDSGALRVSFTSTTGESVDLTEDGLGELAGWYDGGDAWIGRYSRQRFIDDLEDLRRGDGAEGKT